MPGLGLLLQRKTDFESQICDKTSQSDFPANCFELLETLNSDSA